MAYARTKGVRRVKRHLVRITLAPLLVVLLYLGICGYIATVMITPIRKLTDPVPAPAEAVQFESVEDRVPLSGWLLSSWGDRAIVLVHGINSNCWEGGHPDIAEAYVEAGFNVFVFDLRAQGLSGGDRLGLGWHERRDVRGAVDVLLARGFQPGRIGVHGTSYGAATAILSAAVIPEVGAVVADSSWANVQEVMQGEIERRTGFPFVFLFTPGVAFTGSLLYDLDPSAIAPEHAVPDISPRPILFIHGGEDPITPVQHAQRLRAASKNPNDELWILPGLGHTEGVRMGPQQKTISPMREEYLAKVCAFFEGSLK